MTPSIDHPCMGFLCGVDLAVIGGWTLNDCLDAGYGGTLSGCTDPRCISGGWTAQIQRCGPSILRVQESMDPYVVQEYPTLSEDPMNLGGAVGRGCCCGGSGSPAAPSGGGAGGGSSSSAVGGPGGSSCGCAGDWSLFGLPWWLLILVFILIWRMRQ